MKTLLCDNEAARLEALRQYEILDTEPEQAFDDLVQLAAFVCGTPIALINLIDAERQWLKAKVGIDLSEMPRDFGLCPLCVEQGKPLVIPDTLADPQFATNSVVINEPHVRFYAGVPLIVEGQTIGSMCVADTVPRHINDEQVEALNAIARQVLQQLEFRRKVIQLAKINNDYKRLARAVNSVSDGVVISDPTLPDQPVIYVNPAFTRITGYEADEFIGRNCRFLQGDETDPEAIATINQALAEGREVHVTLINYRKDGRTFWNDLKISPVFSETGEVINFVGVQTDITERKRTEEALRQSECTLRSFYDSAPMMMGIVELLEDDIRHISDNAASGKFFGLAPEAMRNRCSSEMGMPKKYLRQWIHYYQEAQRTQAPVTFEYAHDTPTGQKWLRATFSSIAGCCDDCPQFAYVVEDISDRKRAEQECLQLLAREQAARAEAEAARNRVTTILESITDGFLALDEEWRFTYLNEQGEQLLHRTKAELLGKNVWEEFPEAVGLKFYQEYQRAVTQQVSVEFEEFYAPLNRHFQVHAYPARQGGLSVYFQDITERKQADSELQWKEALLRSMTSVSPLAFYVVDNRTDNILYFNDRFCEIWEIEHLKAEIKNQKLTNKDIIPYCSKLIANLGEFIESCQPLQSEENRAVIEDEILLKDGRTIRRFTTQVRDECDSYFGRLYLFEDISDRKRTEQQIREQAALLNITRDAILVRDLDNKIVFWNQSAESLYGWKEDEACGKDANHLLYEKPLPQIEDIHKAVFNQGEWQGELEKVTKSGIKVIVKSSWTLVRDEQGKPKSILIVETDITQKKQLETQFLRAQRMESIGTLASGIAHDLNNVLAPILMSMQLLKPKLKDDKSQQMLAIVESNAKRGANLVKQVLSFARGIEGDRSVLQFKHLMVEMKQIVQQTFPKSISITTDAPKQLWHTCGDPTQLHQVLMNLCVNARDAMPDGGILGITAENVIIDDNYVQMNLEAKAGSYIAITVSDTGTGIHPEIIDRIFEPFFTTKELGKGTGLGLSTVIGIIRSHGGFVTVTSEPDQGTQFKIYLPAVDAAIPAEKEEPQVPVGSGELILVVDDEAAIREITKTSLENHNYQVLTANDGIDAVAIYAENKQNIKAVIVDMMMPNMDGATTIRTLNRMNPTIQIIAVSGLAATDKVATATKAGVQAFLPKPYTAHELLQTISKVMSP